jgi:hypothetical protein
MSDPGPHPIPLELILRSTALGVMDATPAPPCMWRPLATDQADHIGVHTGSMDTYQSGPFSVADVKPYAVPARLDDLQGPDHGIVTLPRDVAWSGRREFDLDDEYDRAAMYKIVLEEGREADQRRLLNWRLLRRDWRNLFPARQARALWENRFPELRHA